MRRYSRIRDELDKLRDAAEELRPEPGRVVLYDASYLRSLPEEEQRAYLDGLIEAKELEIAAHSTGQLGRKNKTVDLGSFILFPAKGSITQIKDKGNEQQD